MSKKFDIIFSENKDYESYFNDDNDKLERLKNLSDINIFVGANNSGKSRFIRSFLKSNTVNYGH